MSRNSYWKRAARHAVTAGMALCVGAAVDIAPGNGIAADAAPITVVDVTGGTVQGIASDTPGVAEFRGIPYAGNVGGENRWKPAPPVEPWEAVMVADTWGDQILQDWNPDSGEPPASDNGLNLVVWTPAESAEDNLPVYMLIHGGANRGGRNSWDSIYAAELASHGVVVVSVQYRTGPFGFLALPEMAEESPDGAMGNYGIMDLVTALEWIQDNIEGFGGDPDTVTIGGQSAGGENTVALLRTPKAEGLFKRAFIQSSFTGFLPGKVVPGAEKAPQNMAHVESVFGKEMTLADLRAIDAETWLSAWQDGEDSLQRAVHQGAVRNQFYTIDDVFYTKDSVNLLQSGDFDGLDIMIGQTADEYTGLRPSDGEMTDAEFREAMLQVVNPYYAGNVDERVFNLYQPDSPADAYRLYLRMKNDWMFQYVRLGAEYAKAHSDSNVYTYYWDHWPPGNNEGFRRAYHSADNRYFNASLRKGDPDQRNWTDPDFEMKRIASTYLANFIKTGDPNGSSVPHWDQVSAGEEAGAFLRFHEGDAEMRTSTVYPSRDAYLRERILEGLDMSEADIGG